MRLLPIPRRKKANPVAKGLGFVKLGLRGLIAARVARRGIKTYKFTKRAVPLAILAVVGVVAAKKLRGGGGGDTGAPSAYPPSTPSATGTPAGSAGTAAAASGTGSSPVTDTAPAPTAPQTPATPDDLAATAAATSTGGSDGGANGGTTVPSPSGGGIADVSGADDLAGAGASTSVPFEADPETDDLGGTPTAPDVEEGGADRP